MSVVWRDGQMVEGRPGHPPGQSCWGLFTTVGCDLGRPLLWPRHEQRLVSSLSGLAAGRGIRLPTEHDLGLLLEIGGLDKSARLQVVARRMEDAVWGVEASASPWDGVGANLVPARLTVERWMAAPPLAGHKTLSRLPWDLAGETARRSGFDDTLLVDSANNLLETSVANVWVVSDDVARTPDAPTRCLPGVMRGWLLEHLATVGLTPEVSALTADDLAEADEIWLSNALIGVRRVASVDDQRWTEWPRFETLTELGVPAPGW
jgi:branched-subunit amino acid aminotransferase/4-amino-4-deoxychorismate lyase